MKKPVSLLLAAVLAVSLLSAPAYAATPAFSDVSDQAVSAKIDSLRMLGVVTGDPNGSFRPNSTLTRAEFCVMAVNAMGNGGQVALYSTRTIFPDVRSSHWARGFINLAASGETRIIAGTTSGLFEPDSPVTYGQAATILVRILGYTDEDTGMLWPDGFIALAKRIGLSDGVTGLGGFDPITRAQAAVLFSNLLTTETKEGGVYAAKLGDRVAEDAVILALDVAGDDGQTDSIRTSDGTYEPYNGIAPQSILGKRGDLVFKNGKLLTILPDRTTQKTVVVSEADAGYLVDSAGTRYTIPPDTAAYDSEGTGVYGEKFVNLGTGSMATLYLDGGRVTGVYLFTGTATDAVVVMGTPTAATFTRLTNGATNYKIYKNGQEIQMKDIQPYDVATYESGVLRISDLRITVLYENAYPNESYPTRITAFGHEFKVLNSAADSASRYQIGSTVTLLLTADGSVAGVESPTVVRSNAVGFVTEGAGNHAKVQLLGGNLVIEADTENDVDDLVGQLVNVSSHTLGKITLNPITGKDASGDFQIPALKLGNTPVSASVVLYERVGDSGALTQVSMEDLAGVDLIPSSQIAYCHLNSNRQVDIIVLNDVTGNAYEYGILYAGVRTEPSVFGDITNHTAVVRNKAHPNADPGAADAYLCARQFESGQPGGLVANQEGTKVIGLVSLTEIRNVSRSDFFTENGITYLSANGTNFRVAENVQCLNKRANSWFNTLDEARAFSSELSAYYDPYGKTVRVVIGY